MGAKDSKLSVISFEDASKRVSEIENARLREAFRRVTAVNSSMTDTVFVREVLWDGVPPNIAQVIYRGYGGTSKGLPYKDLLCGLVILTKGTKEEKIKLIFAMYCDDSGSWIQKSEMDRRLLETEGQVSAALCDLFRESDQVDFEYFSVWLRRHPDATLISKWLLTESLCLSLSGDHDTPTFYQTLAGVTHLEEREILELEKRYWTLKGLSKTGKFDMELFKSQVCPPLPEKLCESLFTAFDENCDNHIDFKEMACGISACCRGPSLERQKFCFKVFDQDHDLRLSEQEVTSMLEALDIARKEYNSVAALQSQNFPEMDPASVAKEILSCHDVNKEGSLTMEDYLMWTVNNQLTTDFLQLLSQICHIVLGLSPQTKEEEGRIIQQWLERESRKPLEVGQMWYLVNMPWWNAWLEYVNTEMTENMGNRTHRISSKNKHGLAWEEESVIMVGPARGAGEGAGNVLRRQNGSSLSLPDTGAHRSPSMSPKLSHKGLSGPPSKPPAINNNPLLVNPTKYISLTNEGGRLRRDTVFARGKDFEIVPECIWRALTSWYGGGPALPRVVINMTGKPDLELYPICVRIMRHQTPSQRPPPATSLSGMVAGFGGMAWNFAGNPGQPRRYHAYTASFSRKHTMGQVYDFLCKKVQFYREDFRLWKINAKDDQNLTLLDDENKMVEEYRIEDMQQVLLEIRNKDLTWPEEMSQLAKNKSLKKDVTPTPKGATGLNNLGNTCFMNAAVQCVSNTWPLTHYFAGNLHLFELNRENPLGMKGHIAQRYGELIKDLWSGTIKTVAPLKLRWTIGKYAPRFNGFQQHDSQEFLSFLLDGLHEDLNRVHHKPYVELKDSDGRPDRIVAREAWENHLVRNQSIVVDLFHGQLMSQVRCKECGHVSVRFDPYSHLSLPLPMDSCIHLEVIVQKLDGSVPIKYGLRLAMDEKYRTLKREVSQLSNIPEEELLIVEVNGPIVKALPRDDQKIRNILIPGSLFMYQLPSPVPVKPLSDLLGGSTTTSATTAITTSTTSSHMSSSQDSLEGQDAARAFDSQANVPIRANGQIPQFSHPLTTSGIDGQHQPAPPLSTATTDPHNAPSSPASTPSHSRNPSNSTLNGGVGPSGSPEAGSSSSSSSSSTVKFENFVIGVHRKMNLMDVYFLSSQKLRPSLFGTPIMIPRQEGTTNQELYQFVWTQIARLVSPLPASEAKVINHAQDCDDSLGYEYPFLLKEVQKDGFLCAKCPWYRFCRGCKVECNAELFGKGSSFLAIDWEATALHLRYQATQEKMFEEHESVPQSRHRQTEPIDLDTCLQAFTKWEELDEDEKYYCSKCKKHCLAAKKLDIWQLPPILIINLKRFQYFNGRWIKSHKIVNFPLKGFDPSAYLAKRDMPPSQTTTSPPPSTTSTTTTTAFATAAATTITSPERSGPTTDVTAASSSSSSTTSTTSNCKPVSMSSLSSSTARPASAPISPLAMPNTAIPPPTPSPTTSEPSEPTATAAAAGPGTDVSQNSSTSSPQSSNHAANSLGALVARPQINGSIFTGNSVLSIEERLKNFDNTDYSHVGYNLYAMSCHTGILGGGHYVAYAKHTNDSWYCYNDSSCKEIQESQLDKNSAYILFYEREGVDFSHYMPDTTGLEPDLSEIDDEFESDFKKMCVVQ